jgi:hypothetical protein
MLVTPTSCSLSGEAAVSDLNNSDEPTTTFISLQIKPAVINNKNNTATKSSPTTQHKPNRKASPLTSKLTSPTTSSHHHHHHQQQQPQQLSPTTAAAAVAAAAPPTAPVTLGLTNCNMDQIVTRMSPRGLFLSIDATNYRFGNNSNSNSAASPSATSSPSTSTSPQSSAGSPTTTATAITNNNNENSSTSDFATAIETTTKTSPMSLAKGGLLFDVAQRCGDLTTGESPKCVVNCAHAALKLWDYVHSNDLNHVQKHMSEVMKLGENTSSIYRLRITQKYAFVQTSSKLVKLLHYTGGKDMGKWEKLNT